MLRSAPDRQPWGAILAFLLPAFTVYTALTAYPVVRTFWNSFHKVLPRSEEYLGLANYAALMQDEIFWRAVRNTFTWACISPLAEVSIALLLALALYAKIPGMRFFRIAWFTPVLMSYVVVGIVWVWMYNYDWGAVNALLRLLGLEQSRTRPGSATRRSRCLRSSSSPPGCGPASTWWCCWRRCIRCPRK